MSEIIDQLVFNDVLMAAALVPAVGLVAVRGAEDQDYRGLHELTRANRGPLGRFTGWAAQEVIASEQAYADYMNMEVRQGIQPHTITVNARLAGRLDLEPDKKRQTVVVRYWTDQLLAGQGIATHALNVAAPVLAAKGYTAMEAHIRDDNPASQRAAAKASFRGTDEIDGIGHRVWSRPTVLEGHRLR